MAVLQQGQMVTSRRGRDYGTVYCVLQIVDDQHVLLADGRRRSTLKPKRKNVKHVVVHPFRDSAVSQALVQNDEITDEHVRKAVARYHGREEGSVGHGER